GAIQRKFADQHILVKVIGTDHSGAGRNGSRNGQIICCSFLANICRCEIDDNPYPWKPVTDILYGGFNTLPSLADGIVGQTDQKIHVLALSYRASGVDLYGDSAGVHTMDGGRERLGKHDVVFKKW